ncbi:MAG: hypothetical protein R3A44_06395 [Caldilineaceae bacterium]
MIDELKMLVEKFNMSQFLDLMLASQLILPLTGFYAKTLREETLTGWTKVAKPGKVLFIGLD